MPAEKMLFHLENVLVTDQRFNVNQHSFALHNIADLHFVEGPVSSLWEASCALLGASAGCAALATASVTLAVVATVFFGLAASIFLLKAPTYSIVLDTADGRFIPLTSASRFLVAGVASVLQSILKHADEHADQRVDQHPAATGPGGKLRILQSRAVQTGEIQRAPMATVIPMLRGRHAGRRRVFHPGKTA